MTGTLRSKKKREIIINHSKAIVKRKPVYIAIIATCILLVLLFIIATICCTFVRKQKEANDSLNSAQLGGSNFASIATVSNSAHDARLDTSREVEIEYDWSDPENFHKIPGELAETAVVMDKLPGNLIPMKCVVRYTQGIQSSRSGRQE